MKRTSLALLLSLSMACTGVLDGPAGPSSDPSGDQGGANGVDDPNNPGNHGSIDLGGQRAPLCAADTRDKKGPRVLRRLTKDEFENTVRAVFGFDKSTYSGSDLSPDRAAANGMTNQVDLLVVDEGTAALVQSSAEHVGDLVVSDAQLSRILPCASTGDDACADTFLDTLGKRLYRRPLTDAERGRYLDLRDTIHEQGGTFKDWVRWATAGLVASPNTMYRSEIGVASDGGDYELTGYERATALAYTFTGEPPSDAMLTAAKNGDYDTKEGMASALKTLAFDASGAPTAQFLAVFRGFVSRWLGVSAFANKDKDTNLFPGWTPAVKSSMRAELDHFIEYVIFQKKGTVKELLTANYTLLDGNLQAFYGYGSGAATDFVVTPRPDNWGTGLLAQGTLLALKATNTDTSPTQRGHLVRGRILCDEIPPPPPVVGELPKPTPTKTTRQRYEQQHAANASCNSCHKSMDRIGFAFEHFDATGRYRAQENGFDIDDSAEIVPLGSGEKDVKVTGPTALAAEVGQREATGACFGAYFAAYSFGFNQKDSACLVSTPRDQLAQDKLSLVDFITSIVTAPHFATRTDQ